MKELPENLFKVEPELDIREGGNILLKISTKLLFIRMIELMKN